MMPLIVIISILPLVAFWGWMFSDMVKNPLLLGAERSTWMWLFVVGNVFAAGWYYINVYNRKD